MVQRHAAEAQALVVLPAAVSSAQCHALSLHPCCAKGTLSKADIQALREAFPGAIDYIERDVSFTITGSAEPAWLTGSTVPPAARARRRRLLAAGQRRAGRRGAAARRRKLPEEVGPAAVQLRLWLQQTAVARSDKSPLLKGRQASSHVRPAHCAANTSFLLSGLMAPAGGPHLEPGPDRPAGAATGSFIPLRCHRHRRQCVSGPKPNQQPPRLLAHRPAHASVVACGAAKTA